MQNEIFKISEMSQFLFKRVFIFFEFYRWFFIYYATFNLLSIVRFVRRPCKTHLCHISSTENWVTIAVYNLCVHTNFTRPSRADDDELWRWSPGVLSGCLSVASHSFSMREWPKNYRASFHTRGRNGGFIPWSVTHPSPFPSIIVDLRTSSRPIFWRTLPNALRGRLRFWRKNSGSTLCISQEGNGASQVCLCIFINGN